MATIASHGRTVVALHLRRTDFGYGRFWIAPSEWYKVWLKSIWRSLDRPVLYIATDDPRSVLDFQDFPTLTAGLLGTDIPGAEFFLDHHVLSQADHLAIANSSFSFTAAMLNARCTSPMRPDPIQRRLVPFDPWDAAVLVDAVDDGTLDAEARQLIKGAIPGQGLMIYVGEACAAWPTVARRTHPYLNVLETQDADIDALRSGRGIAQVQTLVIERPEEIAKVLTGCRRSLGHGRIDAVHFRCARIQRAGELLQPLFDAGFSVFRPRFPSTVMGISPSDTLKPGRHFALNDRLLPLFFGHREAELNLAALLAAHGIRIRGALHVGAHEGQEIATYEQLGAAHVTFVEANPNVHARLVQAMQGRSNVRCVHRAISDRSGVVRLNLASFDQSSSILRMTGHREIYPDIVPAGSVEVRCSTIDELMAELDPPPESFNFMHLDIQGAEGLAIRGAPRTLRHIDALVVEVSFAELYEQGVQIDEIEDLLRNSGFRRVTMLSAFHPSWGDAFYIRDALAT